MNEQIKNTNVNFCEASSLIELENVELRLLLRERELIIKALKSHSFYLRASFKTILKSIINRESDLKSRGHAEKMISQLCEMDEVFKRMDK